MAYAPDTSSSLINHQETAIALKQQALFDTAIHPTDRAVWMNYAENLFITATTALTANAQRMAQGIINWL